MPATEQQDYRLKQALEELSRLEAKLRKTTASLDKQRQHLSGAEAAVRAGGRNNNNNNRSNKGNAWRGASAVEPSFGTFEKSAGTEGHAAVAAADDDDTVAYSDGAAAPSKLNRHHHKAHDDTPQCLGAFVIFNNRESFERCMYVRRPSCLTVVVVVSKECGFVVWSA